MRSSGFAQTDPSENKTSDTTATFRVLPYYIENGDTVPYLSISAFTHEEKDLESIRLQYRVQKVYPYALICTGLLEKFERETAQMNKRQKKKYYKLAQRLLKIEFIDELKNLSVQQGQVLMKLIRRESGINAYDLVKELRGAPTAMVWQAAARLYGSSMKQEYDAKGADAEMEEIIAQIDAGILKVTYRPVKTEFTRQAVKEKLERNKKRRKEARASAQKNKAMHRQAQKALQSEAEKNKKKRP